jgi:hypothetical protein
MPVQRPGLPDEPEVKIQHPLRVGESGHHLALDWNAVRVDFLVEWLTENHDVLARGSCEWEGRVLVKPKMKAFEKVESDPVWDELTLGLVVTSEKDRGREDTLETFHDPVVPVTVPKEVEEIEHL